MVDQVQRLLDIYREIGRPDSPSRSMLAGMWPHDRETLLVRMEGELGKFREDQETFRKKQEGESSEPPRQADLPSGRFTSGGGVRVIKKADGL